MGGQRGDVLATFGQRRRPQHHAFEAVVRSPRACAPLGDHALDVAMRGRDDADVGPFRAASADGHVFALLEEAQQLHLHRRRRFADLVEEQRPAVGDGDQARPVLVRAGEGALEVAEQFALEQVGRDRAAMHGDERFPRAPARRMQGAGDKLLARSRRAEDQDRRLGRADAGDQLAQPLHRRARADHAVGRRLPAQALDLPLQRRLLQGALDGELQQFGLDGLGQEIPGSGRDRRERVFVVGVRGQHDDRNGGEFGNERKAGLRACARAA